MRVQQIWVMLGRMVGFLVHACVCAMERSDVYLYAHVRAYTIGSNNVRVLAEIESFKAAYVWMMHGGGCMTHTRVFNITGAQTANSLDSVFNGVLRRDNGNTHGARWV